MFPLYIDLHFLTITIEGLFAVGTLIIGFFYQRYNSLKAGYSNDWFVSAYTFAILTGMLFARLFHFMFWDTDRFLANPLIIIQGGGGMAVLGATIGTGLGGWIYSRMTGVNFLHWCDGLMAPICICLAIGRVACFANGDAYGMPTGSALGMTFSEASVDWTIEWRRLHHLYANHENPLAAISQIFRGYVNLGDIPLPAALEHLRAEGVQNLADLTKYYPPQATGDYVSVLEEKGLRPFPVVYPPVHATQLYEFAIMFVAFLIVLRLQKAEWARQKLFFIFWILYGVNRLVIETLRFDRNVAFGSLTYAQVISIGLVIFGVAGTVYTIYRWRDSGPPEPVLK
ncbi:MAG: prolipoprotein diacylglyceryl transferase [bacterium]|nr:prolipoprotein diacylglyceryl transferase [bacterium]